MTRAADARRRSRRRRPRGGSARLRHLDLRRPRRHARDASRRGHLGVSALLGRSSRRSSRRTRSCSPASSCGRSISPSRTMSTCCCRPRSASGTSTRSITSAAVTVIVIVMAAGAGYAISQLDFPGRRALLVDDPGELHGADPGADRHPLHPAEPARADQHARRRRRARSSSRR